MAQHVYGVDLGTSNIKMYSLASDTILNEKNVIAIKNKHEIIKFGDFAFEMYEKAPGNIEVTFPVKFGVIADIQNMETLFSCFYKKINNNKAITGADFCIAVPTDITEVEKRAFYDVIMDAKVKAKRIVVVEKPIADAVGVGIDVNSPNGHLLVNIGADTTEISVISLGGLVLSHLTHFGGNRFDEAIINYFKRNYNLVIGQKTAMDLKEHIGCAIPGGEGKMIIVGLDVVSGLPIQMEITAEMVYSAMKDNLETLCNSIKMILEKVPPELAKDIMNAGIYMTGGGSKLLKLDVLFKELTNINVNICDDPDECVAKGLSLVIKDAKYSGLAYSMRTKIFK